MIKRKVIIVKGYSKTENECLVDNYYVNAYKSYFQNNAGGAYFPKEIIYLSEPSCKELLSTIKKHRLDFLILVFIGHGAMKNGYQLFQLNSNDVIFPGQISIKCKKQIIIIESCRVIADYIPTVDLEDKIPAFEKGGIFRMPINMMQSREIYDSHIKRCENGVMICFACGPNQEAQNFIFSQSFIQSAIDWHMDSSRHCAILPIDELCRITWAKTVIAANEIGIVQTPYNIGILNFPIGVSKF